MSIDPDTGWDEDEEAHAFIGHKGLGDEFLAWVLARRAEVDALLELPAPGTRWCGCDTGAPHDSDCAFITGRKPAVSVIPEEPEPFELPDPLLATLERVVPALRAFVAQPSDGTARRIHLAPEEARVLLIVVTEATVSPLKERVAAATAALEGGEHAMADYLRGAAPSVPAPDQPETR